MLRMRQQICSRRQTQKRPKSGSKLQFQYKGAERSILPSLYARPIYDFDLRTSHARTLLPAALASVFFGFVSAQVRVCKTPYSLKRPIKVLKSPSTDK